MRHTHAARRLGERKRECGHVDIAAFDPGGQLVGEWIGKDLEPIADNVGMQIERDAALHDCCKRADGLEIACDPKRRCAYSARIRTRYRSVEDRTS